MLGFSPISDQPISSLAATTTGTTFTITPTGGIAFGGSVLYLQSKVFIPSGGILLGGSGLGLRTKFWVPAGGITFAGTGNIIASTTPVSTQSPERTKVGVGT